VYSKQPIARITVFRRSRTVYSSSCMTGRLCRRLGGTPSLQAVHVAVRGGLVAPSLLAAIQNALTIVLIVILRILVSYLSLQALGLLKDERQPVTRLFRQAETSHLIVIPLADAKSWLY
jgi:hypothetical protein